MVQNPRLIVIAGSNGAGKSTFTRNAHSLNLPIIDPDAEARAINPDNPESIAVAAGKVAIRRAREYLSNNQSFAVETTLSGSTYLKMMRDAKAKGYETNLIYVGIDNVETNIGRVATRVLAGGHNVPDEDVRRRYERSLNNLPKVKENSEIPIGVQLVIQGSQYDMFVRSRDLLVAQPDKINELNQLKLSHFGGDMGKYVEDKGAFFTKLLQTDG
ncbi:hypothetical protein NIES4071_09780 [Calothrix sp. NIES-4071]|nr:hypothetical protein NIES4071_09780 [Calothrix sp. NIES-4071]BAZ55320.1 hypothetical protein NIES4105_09740 [Calothrix sp. NIES-4105]